MKLLPNSPYRFDSERDTQLLSNMHEQLLRNISLFTSKQFHALMDK